MEAGYQRRTQKGVGRTQKTAPLRTGKTQRREEVRADTSANSMVRFFFISN